MPKANRIYRVKTPNGFKFQDGFGRPITDQETLDFINGLVIPPAWERVEINPLPGAKIHATGYDAAGRKQYIYSQKWREKRDKEKFDRILAFANALPMMRRITAQHLRHRKLDREKVLACMTRLIDMAYFRVGNERYAKENHTFGLSTMRSRHLKIEGDKLIFHFVGKSHKEHIQEIENHALAKIVRELDHLPGYEIFKYYNDDGELVDVTSEDLNNYIKEIMGYDFSAKDFRTWAGTLIAAVALAECGTDCTKTQAKKNIKDAIEKVSQLLGNTPAIAKASYIDPRVIEHYLDGQTIQSYLGRIDRTMKEEDLLGAAEVSVLKLLKRRLRAKQPVAKGV
jgi:DNA topoisomerase I